MEEKGVMKEYEIDGKYKALNESIEVDTVNAEQAEKF